MKRRILLHAILLAGVSISTAASAFSLGSVTNALSGSSASNSLSDEKEALAKAYSKAFTSITTSQKELAQALNLKKELDAIADNEKALRAGNVLDSAKEISATSKTINEEIKKQLTKASSLSTEQKKHISKGILDYSLGVAEVGTMGLKAKDLAQKASSAIESADMLGKAKITKEMASSLTLVKNLPDLMKELISTGNQLVSLGQKKGIDTKSAKKQLLEQAKLTW